MRSEIKRSKGAVWLSLLPIAYFAFGPGDAYAVCTRQELNGFVDDYFRALAAHDPSSLPLADNVRYTENGIDVALGQGIWQTAGPVQSARNVFDTERCSSLTESVIVENGMPIIVRVRLDVQNELITEIDATIARDDPLALEFAPPTD